MAEPYDKLPTAELLRRVSENPPDTPDWINSRAELDRRAASSGVVPAPMRESEFVEALSTVTRSERRLLLIVSTVMITIVQAGLVPTRVETLGIVLTATEQRSVLLVGAGIAAYLLVAFAVYAGADVRAWREDQTMLATQKARHITAHFRSSGQADTVSPLEMNSIGQVAEEMLVETWPRKRWAYVVKQYFDFWAPFPIALYAVVASLTKALAG